MSTKKTDAHSNTTGHAKPRVKAPQVHASSSPLWNHNSLESASQNSQWYDSISTVASLPPLRSPLWRETFPAKGFALVFDPLTNLLLVLQAHRIITQAIITGGRVFGRAFGEAYRHAQQSSAYQRAQAKAGGSAGGMGGAGSMTTQEACQILNVKEPSPTAESLEEVHSRFKRLFDANDPEKGGSFYLQSKILRARERLEADLRPKMEQAELDAEVQAGWKPNLYKEKPKEPPKL